MLGLGDFLYRFLIKKKKKKKQKKKLTRIFSYQDYASFLSYGPLKKCGQQTI